MGGCRCTFRNCTNNSANSPGLHFFTFPLRNTERCHKWIIYSDNPNFLTMPAVKLRNKVVCEKHFRDDCFMNYKKERLVSTAIPTLFPLPGGLVLDYEESINPEPKKLEPTTQKHLIPPANFEEAKELEEEQFSLVEEQSSASNQATYIIEELETPDVENMETVDSFEECFVISTPKQKMRKLEKSAVPSQYYSSKILNKSTMPRKFPAKLQTFTRSQRSPVTLSINASDVSRTESARKTSDSEDSYKCEIDCRSNQDLNNKKSDTGKEIQAVSSNSVAETLVKGDHENVVTSETGERRIAIATEFETVDTSPPEKCNTLSLQQSVTQDINDRDNEDALTNKDKYLETLAEHEKQIKTLEKLLLEPETKKGPQKTGTQVETISTSRKTESLGTGGITKQQLFNGIKKYLTPSMVSFVRMEMFGGPDREWKSDEKAVVVELLQLGNHVFDYVRDEWRFRLPPKKDVEKWQKEYSNISDEEEF